MTQLCPGTRAGSSGRAPGSGVCATANPVEVILAESEQGRGILGVVDGSSPKGIESANDREWRHGLLRKIGYKR